MKNKWEAGDLLYAKGFINRDKDLLVCFHQIVRKHQ